MNIIQDHQKVVFFEVFGCIKATKKQPFGGAGYVLHCCFCSLLACGDYHLRYAYLHHMLPQWRWWVFLVHFVRDYGVGLGGLNV